MKLNCFAVTIDFDNKIFDIKAATKPEGVETPSAWFANDGWDEEYARSVAGEILGKLKDAVEHHKDGIDVTVKEDNLLIMKSPPAAAVAVAAARVVSVTVNNPVIVVQTQPQTIDLNKATEAQLCGLPGVGPATAPKIIAGRPFKNVDDLMKIDGIGDAKMAGIKPLVTV